MVVERGEFDLAGTGEKLIHIHGAVFPLQKLVNLAKAAMERAYVPYSKFPVGAALLTIDGHVYSGCNIENASYGLTCCAERVAVFKAVADGAKEFKTLVIIANTEEPCSPCGACRQVMSEFAPDMEVYMFSKSGEYIKSSVNELLPSMFSLK